MFTSTDIETTGLTASDLVTVIGFVDEDQYTIYYNAAQGKIDENEFDWESADKPIELQAGRNEDRLLGKLEDAVTTHGLNSEGEMLVGFNAESFDFPFLRTRCLIKELGWPLAGVNYLDIMWPFQNRWNTKGFDVGGFNKHPLIDFADHIGLDANHSMNKYEIEPEVRKAERDESFDMTDVVEFCTEEDEDIPTTSHGKLDGVHDLYCELGVFEEVHDPFVKSKECISAWAEGNIEDIVRHNLSDLRKTQELVELLPDYLPDDDLRMTKL